MRYHYFCWYLIIMFIIMKFLIHLCAYEKKNVSSSNKDYRRPLPLLRYTSA